MHHTRSSGPVETLSEECFGKTPVRDCSPRDNTVIKFRTMANPALAYFRIHFVPDKYEFWVLNAYFIIIMGSVKFQGGRALSQTPVKSGD